jgi:hypothetical protein
VSAALERALAALWADVLGRARIEVTEPFRGQGADRAAAADLVSRINEAFGVTLTPDTPFTTGSTVRDMAALVRAGRRQDPATTITRRAGDWPAPLSFGQQRLWVMDQLLPGNPFYNVPLAYRLRGPLDEAALSEAVTGLVARHEVLRTRFDVTDGVPVQVVDEDAEVSLMITDMTGPQSARLRRAVDHATREARRPFDLRHGPPLRALLLRVGPADAIFQLTLHHAAVDGWSSEVIVRELSELYAAAHVGRPARLSPLPVTYRDFAAWQRDRLRGPVLAGELRWWLDRLGGLPAELPLPGAAARPPVASFAGAAVPFTLGQAATEALRELGRRHHTTLFMCLLAGCHGWLSRVSGSTDVLVGTPTTGRTRPEVAGLVGFFVNTVVMRGDCTGDPDFGTLLGRTRDWALAAYAHQDVPFEQLVKALAPDRDLSRPALVQVLVQLEPADPVPGLAGVRATRLTNVEGGVRADLEIHFHDGPDGVTGEFVYATDLFDADTARELAGGLVRMLHRAAARPGDRLSESDSPVPTGRTR